MTTRLRRKGMGALLAMVFVLGLGTLGLQCEALDNTALVVEDDSAADVYAVYIQTVASRPFPERLDHNDWGPNLIPVGEVLQPGASRAFHNIPNDAYDLLAVGYRSVIDGGGLVRWPLWDVALSGGVYRWQLAPVKSGSDDLDAVSVLEQTSVLPAIAADSSGPGN